MPLKKSASKAAVSANIKAELGAGKPSKQAIAIAMDVRRRAKAKAKARKHCTCGGKCDSCRH
jgi:hypothetical protein